MFREIAINDIVRMRKAHPCGGFEWKVVRLGADIGLVCQTCQHRILLSRRDLEHRTKKLIPAEVGLIPGEPQNTDQKNGGERKS